MNTFERETDFIKPREDSAIPGLDAFKAVDFDPVVKLDEVWRRSFFHVDALHAAERRRILARLMQVDNSRVSYGYVVTGASGAGKTHLLGSLRQELSDRPEFHGITFIYADMWALTPGNFRQTLLNRVLDSLMRRPDEENGDFQYRRVLLHLMGCLGKTGAGAQNALQVLSTSEPQWIDLQVGKIVSTLKQRQRTVPAGVRDVLRALFVLNSDDERADFAQIWLGAGELESGQQERLCLSTPQVKPLALFSSLAWVLNLCGAIFLAVDQIDSAAHGTSPATTAIVTELVNGLASIISSVPGVFVLMAAFEDSWMNIRQIAQTSDLARFSGHGHLRDLSSGLIAQALVAARLEKIYGERNFRPFYPTWPFKPEAFVDDLRVSPRELLGRCARHQEKCLEKNRVIELDSFETLSSSPPHIRENLSLNLSIPDPSAPDPRGLLEEEREDELGELIEFACTLLLTENPPSPSKGREAVVLNREYPRRGIKPLHALIEWNGGEKYYAFRVLQKTAHSAYGPRLKAALQASGISRGLKSRHLLVFRSLPLPMTPKMKDLTTNFENEGGLFAPVTVEHIAILLTLKRIREEKERGFEAWLQERRPVSKSGLFDPIMGDLLSDLGETEEVLSANRRNSTSFEQPEKVPSSPEKNVQSPDETDTASDFPDPAEAEKEQAEPEPSGENVIEVTPHREELLLGLSSSMVGQVAPAILPLGELRSHAVILAGSGSGKTTLLRRLVEESALCGIPAIVIDGKNDLARMGDRWDERPSSWLPGDEKREKSYFEEVGVTVWTPQVSQGRPLTFAVLPDFGAIRNIPDVLDEAVDLTFDILRTHLTPGKGKNQTLDEETLYAAIRAFAHLELPETAKKRMDRFVEFLSDLPQKADADIAQSRRKASDLAELLNTALQSEAIPQDGMNGVEELLAPQEGRTRISVVNLGGFRSLEQKRAFMKQLTLHFLIWLMKSPTPGENLKALLAVDDAHDFVRSGKASAPGSDLLRLSAQAHKFGLGILFAAQHSFPVDKQLQDTAKTWFLGRAQSPHAVNKLENLMQEWNGSAGKIPHLKRGEFMMRSAGSAPAPLRLAAAMGYSAHGTVLSRDEVINRAREENGIKT